MISDIQRIKILKIIRDNGTQAGSNEFFIPDNSFKEILKTLGLTDKEEEKIKEILGLDPTNIGDQWHLSELQLEANEAIIRYSCRHNKKQWDQFVGLVQKAFYAQEKAKRFFSPIFEESSFSIPISFKILNQKTTYLTFYQNIIPEKQSVEKFEYKGPDAFLAEKIAEFKQHDFSVFVPYRVSSSGDFFLYCVLGIYKYCFAMEITIRTSSRSWEPWESVAAFLSEKIGINIEPMLREEIETDRDEISENTQKES